jgi:hypothetical protein
MGHLSSISLSKVQEPFGTELIQLNSQAFLLQAQTIKFPIELTRRNSIRTEQTYDTKSTLRHQTKEIYS